jgi:hypothetical protein
MTTAVLPGFALARNSLRYDTGCGPVARKLKERIIGAPDATRDPRQDAIEQDLLRVVAQSLEAASMGDDVVTRQTAERALSVFCLLPQSIPLPTVLRDPDGEISLDWQGRGGTFSVSIDWEGRLAYTARYLDGSRARGIERLRRQIPKTIVEGIRRVAGD